MIRRGRSVLMSRRAVVEGYGCEVYVWMDAALDWIEWAAL